MSNQRPAAVPDEVHAVTAHCRSVLPAKETWFAPPGWPNSLALCVLDAVWSLGSTYKTVVFPILDRYGDHRRAQGAAPEKDSGVDLIRVFDEVGGPRGFADKIGNHRPAHTKPGAPMKAASVRQAAQVLAQHGVTTTADLVAAVALPHQPLKAAWHRVPGNGVASWRYLLMLAGDEHIKPDRMVHRFVANALGAEERGLTMVRAADALAASAVHQEVGLRVLDHTVWLYQSGLASKRRR